MNIKKWAKSIQNADYNGARTVVDEVEEKQNRSKSSTKGYHSYEGVQRAKSVKH